VHSPSLKAEARKLRSAHFSLKAVAAKLGISKSTASLWLRDMPSAIAQKRGAGDPEFGNASHKRAVAALKKWRLEAEESWQRLREEPLFMLGLGLYWGEGDKTTKSLGLSNNDARLIKVWIAWCRQYFPAVALSGRVQIHPDVDGTKARQYWSRVTGVTINPHAVYTKARKDKTPTRISIHGTIRIRACVGSTECFVKTMYWISKLNADVM
jgi:hypothetical protein